ncbi:hypothetical protein BH24BAC1_BH24BAC1_10940 [soil metagenome]
MYKLELAFIVKRLRIQNFAIFRKIYSYGKDL